jgi:hypothetical protein
MPFSSVEHMLIWYSMTEGVNIYTCIYLKVRLTLTLDTSIHKAYYIVRLFSKNVFILFIVTGFT